MIMDPLAYPLSVLHFTLTFNHPQLREVTPMPDFQRTTFRSLPQYFSRVVIFGITPKVSLIGNLSPAGPVSVICCPVSRPLVVGVRSDSLHLAVFIVCFPHTFPEPAVDRAFHAPLSILVKVLPHAVVGVLPKYSPHLHAARLVEKLPNPRSFIIGKLSARFGMAVQIIRFIFSVKHVADSVPHMINLLQVFLLFVVIGPPLNTLRIRQDRYNRKASCQNIKKVLHYRLLTTD